MPSPGEGRRPMGELLVQHGVVTPAQLALALERQQTTGQQLGKIIVELGFAPGAMVAQALATQRGQLIKTEYGFATGWSAKGAPIPGAEPAATDAVDVAGRDRTIAELRSWAKQAEAAIAQRDDALIKLRDWVRQAQAVIAARDEAILQLRAELADRSTS